MYFKRFIGIQFDIKINVLFMAKTVKIEKLPAQSQSHVNMKVQVVN